MSMVEFNKENQTSEYLLSSKNKQVIAFSDVNAPTISQSTSLGRREKRVSFSNDLPTVYIFDKDKSVKESHVNNPENMPQMELHAVGKVKLHSPKLYRNYIPPPVILEEKPLPKSATPRRYTRKKLLKRMSIWNSRRRIKRTQQSQNLIESRKKRLQLSMKYGELSDSFYSYCRRWKKHTNFLVRRDPPSPVKTFSLRPSLPLHFNFRFFTRIMIQAYKSRLVHSTFLLY